MEVRDPAGVEDEQLPLGEDYCVGFWVESGESLARG